MNIFETSCVIYMKTTASLTNLNAHLVVMDGKDQQHPKSFHPWTFFSSSFLLIYCRSVMTGSYDNDFHIYDVHGKTDITLQADKSAFRARRVGSSKNRLSRK